MLIQEVAEGDAQQLNRDAGRRGQGSYNFDGMNGNSRTERGDQHKQTKPKQVHRVPKKESTHHQADTPTAVVGVLKPDLQSLRVHIAADKEEQHRESEIERDGLGHRASTTGGNRGLKMILNGEPDQRG